MAFLRPLCATLLLSSIAFPQQAAQTAASTAPPSAVGFRDFSKQAAIDKQFVGRRPQTTCRLSKLGRQAFARYLDNLQAIVQRGREQAGA